MVAVAKAFLGTHKDVEDPVWVKSAVSSAP
jgi:hypothetical protein